jgi:hypothetical protein
LSLFGREFLVALEDVIGPVTTHDTMLSQYASDHVLDGCLVVFDLTSVLCQERLCDGFDSRTSAGLQQCTNHYRLIDVRHTHFRRYEGAQQVILHMSRLLLEIALGLVTVVPANHRK